LADGGDPLLAVLRFLLFSLLAVVAPGIALQRLLRVRWVPALVLPLGLAWCALAWWLALAAGRPFLFPALTVPALVVLWRPGRPAPGPSLPGALPPLALLVALFALTQYGVNRVDREGAFLLDLGEHVDTALHVGVSFELVAGYPPQVPGLAGVPMRYHVGSHLVRAAAVRWAGIHPYDAISRFDITLWAIALVLALRAAAQAVGLGERAVALAGFLPLLCDLSFLPGLLQGARWWAFRLGDNFVEPLFYANSITPALAMALGCVVALARAERGEGGGFTVLAAVLAAAAGFFKVFTGAQLVLALGLALLLRRDARRRMLAIVLPAAVTLAALALRSVSPVGAAGVSVHLVPFAPLLPALQSFGMRAPQGPAFLLAGLLWVVLSLGLRLAGVPAATLALGDSRGAGRALAAFALCGWPLAAVFSITADPDCDEAFYLLQASGLLLWLFAVPTLAKLAEGGAQRSAWRRVLAATAIAAVTLPSTVEFLVRKAEQPPEALPAAAVEAMAALRRASCPGDVVITRPLPRAQWVPLPVVLAGRRVAFSNYLGYWRQFVSPAFVSGRDKQVRAFFRSTRPEAARQIADALGARFAYLTGPQHVDFDAAALLEPVFDRDGERVYRIGAGGSDCGDEGGASVSTTR